MYHGHMVIMVWCIVMVYIMVNVAMGLQGGKQAILACFVVLSILYTIAIIALILRETVWLSGGLSLWW